MDDEGDLLSFLSQRVHDVSLQPHHCAVSWMVCNFISQFIPWQSVSYPSINLFALLVELQELLRTSFILLKSHGNPRRWVTLCFSPLSFCWCQLLQQPSVLSGLADQKQTVSLFTLRLCTHTSQSLKKPLAMQEMSALDSASEVLHILREESQNISSHATNPPNSSLSLLCLHTQWCLSHCFTDFMQVRDVLRMHFASLSWVEGNFKAVGVQFMLLVIIYANPYGLLSNLLQIGWHYKKPNFKCVPLSFHLSFGSKFLICKK
jgi:hypothetical protein